MNPLDRWGTLYRIFGGRTSRLGFGRTSRFLYAIFRGYEAGPLENLMIRTLGGRTLRGPELLAYAQSRKHLWRRIRRIP